MHPRRWLVSAVCLSLVGIVLLGGITPAQDEPKAAPAEIVDDARLGRPIVKGQLLVTLHQGVKEEELKPIFERLEAKYEVVRRIESFNQYAIATDHERLPELRQRLENHPYVAAASYNAIVTMKQMPLKKPAFNDPVFKKPDDKLEDADNWNLYRIKANEAWDVTTGGALIAIVDSGAKLDHEELVGRASNPWTFAVNPAAREGLKKLRDAQGKPYDYEVRNHGTHVAITAAGAGNNGVGTSGVAPGSPLLPVQVLYYVPSQANDGTGGITGDTYEIVAGMEHAINNGASVINMSLGTYLPKDAIQRWRNAATPQARQDVERALMPAVQEELKIYGRALDLANRRGVIVVAAAGNDGMPAHLYALPLSGRTIAVAATTREDKRWNDVAADGSGYASNFGPYTTVSAPGKDVWSGFAQPGMPYTFLSGTSMAAPHVTGVAALMKTVDPELKLADVADILVKTGRPLTTDAPIGPLVNAKAAVDETKRRKDARLPRQPEPPPIIVPPPQPPNEPTLPPAGIDILRQPDPWNNVEVQRIMLVWLSIALPAPPGGAEPGGFWIYNQYGQIINVRVSINIERPIWFRFSFRWLWENSLTLESTNMGSLYEFVYGTLRTGRFTPAPRRVPENVRPDENAPRPPAAGLRFDPTFRNTRWLGRNARGDTIDIEFAAGAAGAVVIKRGDKTTRYTVRINTYLDPPAIDFYPEGGGDPVLGLLNMANLGEVLLRTDFTDKRPVSVSRGDPLTFILQRTDIKIENPGGTDDGVQSQVLHQGAESLFRNLQPLKKLDPKTVFHATVGHPWLHHYALSGDGQRLWLLLYDPRPESKKNPWQLWTMKTDGADAQQHAYTPHAKATGAPTVVTNHDGGSAWIFAPKIEPFSDYHQVQIQQVKLGGAPRIVVDTKEIKGVTRGKEPRLTADGRSLFFLAEEGIVQVKEDGHTQVITDKKRITHKGVAMNPADPFVHLRISDDGAHWAVAAQFHYGALYAKPATHPQVVLVGSAKGHRMHVAKGYNEIDGISMSHDGATVLIQEGAQHHKPRLAVWRDGVPQPIHAEAATLHGGILAGGGRHMYGLCGGAYPYLEDLATGRRRSLFSGIWPPRAPQHVALSHDGSVLTAWVPTFDFAPNGVFIFRDGAAPSAHHPRFKSIRQRYEGSKLIITVEAEAPDALGRVLLFPLKNGYIPPQMMYPATAATGGKAPAHNALSGVSVGSGDHPLTPVPKRPGVYQTSVEMGPGHAHLDPTFSLRVIVVNAENTRATFQDVAVLR